MSDKLKITFTGGGSIGDTVEVPVSGTVLVGRSHSAAIRLKEADVSGRHLEIVRTAEGFYARNLSRFGSKVDGRHVSEGEQVDIRRGSVIEVGARARFRIDALPSAGLDDGTSGGAIPPGATEATVCAGGETVATRAGTVPTVFAHISSASVEESATRDAFSVVSSKPGDGPEEEPEPECVLGVAADEADTADIPPDMGETVPCGGDPDATARSSEFIVTSPQRISVAEEEPSDGETQELRTRVGSIEEILERKRQLERKTSARHWRFGVAVVLVLAAIAGIWFATASGRNVTDAEGPFKPDGELDVAEMDICDGEGSSLMFLEYPNDPRAEIVRSADSNQVEVSSFLGRDRDIPFRICFSRSEDRAELGLSLVESFEAWMKFETAEGGFTFEAMGARRPEIEFYEDAFSTSWMEYPTQCGVPFVRSEYTRTVGSVLWRGMAYRLRSGSSVYSFRTEVPETFWRRAGYKIKGSPFVGLYGLFINEQWDSPGRAGFVTGRSEDELVVFIRHELTAEGQRTWPLLEKSIDTLVAMTWGKETPNAKSAREFLDAFLSRKTRFYNERSLAYETSRLGGDDRRTRRILEDCRDMFAMLRRDRRYNKVNDPEVWKCQKQR